MIIEHHGGELTASSDGRSGALFQFVLPAMAPEEHLRQARSSAPAGEGPPGRAA
jgi:K+-sensing histidine kinase KdpD